MASGVATIAAPALVSVPVVGWIVGAAAAYVDAVYLAPALMGKGRGAMKPPRLQDVPVGSNEAGAPRIWAIGARVRVPTHILWQKQKVREETTNHHKEGTSVLQREVLIDALVSLNDRKTIELTQLVGNGKLLVWESRNLARITTNEMTAAPSGADLVITMANTLSPSPTDVFKLKDFVKLYGWVSTSGPNINGFHWQIKAITGHTSTPGTITLEVAQGQSVAGVVANAGSPFTPAWIERVDDALVGKTGVVGISPYIFVGTQPNFLRLVFDFGTNLGAYPPAVFNVGDRVRVVNVNVNGQPITVEAVVDMIGGAHPTFAGVFSPPGTIVLYPADPGATQPGQWPSPGSTSISTPSATNWPRIEFFSPQHFAGQFFPAGFVPRDHYHNGSSDQGEDAIIVAEKGTGNVPGYRGLAYQAIDRFKATQFGGQLPYALEALVRPDESMTWAQALALVLRRAGLPSSAVNCDGVSLRPFLGYFIRGAVATASAIQPLLLAGSILGQERDGVLCMFQLETADIVQIGNGPSFSDLGAHIYGEPRQDDKITTSDDAQEDLPTSMGVRHQDPDNAYADGFQHFGLRNPGGVAFENRQEIDVSTLVLTRKDARNLATQSVKRAWINNRKYGWALDARFIDLLENDLQTVTDDDGNVLIGRVAQRDIGANYLVQCKLVREDLVLPVNGSPVQTVLGPSSPPLVVPAVLDFLVLDMPSLADSENNTPALRFAACARPGSHWAGARLYESFDGANWTPVESFGEQSAIGLIQADTPAVAGPSETYGSSVVAFRSSAVDVIFSHEGTSGISSCTQQEALNGQNWCVLVDPATGDIELAAFTTATLTGTRRYTLDGWLRGLRGTRASVKPAGSFVVMVAQDYPTLRREYSGLSQPTSMAFRMVPAGKTFEEVETITIASTWRNTRPLPVRRIVKTIGGSPFDARFTVENWTRQHLPLGTLPPYVMDEIFEGYKLTIWNPAGTIVKRIKTIQASPGMGTQTLRDRWFDYPSGEQAADGYTPGAATTFTIDVQQFGAFGATFGLSDSVKQVI